MIVVTGATGTIGSELVRLLAERGARVRAVSRQPPKGKALPGVEWVAADLADRAGLPRVLAGAARLFLLTGNDEDMVRLQKNALRAAAEAGVAHVVKLSALGASDHSKSVIGLWHHVVERELRDVGAAAWTILRPHHFMQNVLEQRRAIREEGVLRSPAGEGRIPFIDTRDIAEVAAVALTEEGHEGKVYTLTGPEAISYRDAAAILAEVTGRPLRYEPESEEDAFLRLHRQGEPAWRIGGLLAIAAYQRAGGPTERTTDTVREVTGRAARSFRRFVEDHAGMF